MDCGIATETSDKEINIMPEEKAKQYRYFVSYAHGDGALGFGCSEIGLPEPITGFGQIAEIRNFLLGSGLRKVTVLGWQRFDDSAANVHPQGTELL